MSPRTAWWLPAIVGAGMCLVFSAAHLAFGGIAAGIAYLGWAVAWVLWQRAALMWFRSGWHAGVAETLMVLRADPGTPPAALLRQMATGDAAPNPWEIEARIHIGTTDE